MPRQRQRSEWQAIKIASGSYERAHSRGSSANLRAVPRGERRRRPTNDNLSPWADAARLGAEKITIYTPVSRYGRNDDWSDFTNDAGGRAHSMPSMRMMTAIFMFLNVIMVALITFMMFR